MMLSIFRRQPRQTANGPAAAANGVQSSFASDLRFAWKLIRAYWTSSDRWAAWGLVLLIAAIEGLLIYNSIWSNTWSRQFFDALTNRDLPAFWQQVLVYLVILLPSMVLLFNGTNYVRQVLEMRWRTHATNAFAQRWLGNNRFYVIERARSVENPDQRIAEDLGSAAKRTIDLVTNLLSRLVALGSFAALLWVQSGSLAFSIAGFDLTIPGYMLWLAVLYAIVGTAIAHYAGRKLVHIDVLRQRFEADFRVRLVRVRDNAEQIAFYDGARTEQGRLHEAFAAVRRNWWQVIKYTFRISSVVQAHGNLNSIIAYVMMAPKYFAGTVTFGGVQQISNSFGQVVNVLSWFAMSYQQLAEWRATMERLRALDAAIDRPDHVGVAVRMTEFAELRTAGLRLDLPDGTALISVGALFVAPGERVLLQGRSGVGKSTLLRALAGLWPYGDGTVESPARKRMMFLPQRNYVPIGTLKAALCYPAEPERFDAEACRAALAAVRLSAFSDRLDETDDWGNRLSPGEQQRLAAARALLHRPDFLFLDEATSALDPDLERIVYEAIIGALPDTAVISVAHRPAVAKYHHRIIQIGEPVAAPAFVTWAEAAS